jgi:hypothetical protein
MGALEKSGRMRGLLVRMPLAVVVTHHGDHLQPTGILVETLAAPHFERQVPPPQHPIRRSITVYRSRADKSATRHE